VGRAVHNGSRLRCGDGEGSTGVEAATARWWGFNRSGTFVVVVFQLLTAMFNKALNQKSLWAAGGEAQLPKSSLQSRNTKAAQVRLRAPLEWRGCG
jgi:hypothetical protein